MLFLAPFMFSGVCPKRCKKLALLADRASVLPCSSHIHGALKPHMQHNKLVQKANIPPTLS